MVSDKDLLDIQGDIWPGLPKEFETFYLFQIKKDKVSDFKSKLKAMADDHTITSAKDAQSKRQAKKDKKDPGVGINIAFSSKGMDELGWGRGTLKRGETLKDRSWDVGMKTDMLDQGRDDAQDWTTPDGIHGVFLICGSKAQVEEGVKLIESRLKDAITHLDSMTGNVRPGDCRGYEHFGFKDTISQPAMDDFPNSKPEDSLPYKCAPGRIIVNRAGMMGTDHRTRLWEPEWATNGSYFVLRKMKQLVKEFHEYSKKEAKSVGMTPEELEARFVGRWKSGAPLEKYPKEDPGPGHSGNNWMYEPWNKEVKCPFASHIRKCNPRNTNPNAPTSDESLIMRRGIPYGPECGENADAERGLLFGCYQSSIMNGFMLIQNRWIYNDAFPAAKAGQDAIAGQDIKGAATEEDKMLSINLYGPDGNEKKSLRFPSFVKIRGGEYFFTPPISFFDKF
ncbi:hypothetical protein FE257_010788 [Aspergillus nanangensis]|uniref:Dyp-type peroxidase n=1 Tax=Aspergillus nanangensis TaxID=2582783 RepID=A0AAD4CVH4_ASPNN|nr:hypothetical protein FE257_010788 [Aspergillus nanangensis]